jgi:hypothetical protein
MKRSIFAGMLACACIVSGACTESDAPKTPLGAAPQGSMTGSAPVSPIGGEAKRALDSANLLFRAKEYGLALEQYRRSSELAPAEMAPLMGILMVADVTKDTKLADSTLPKLRKLNPAVADSSVVSPHSRIPEGHPPLTTPET